MGNEFAALWVTRAVVYSAKKYSGDEPFGEFSERKRTLRRFNDGMSIREGNGRSLTGIVGQM